MSKVRHVDFYPDEFMTGVSGVLTAEQIGVYWVVCSLVMSQGGPIDENYQRLGMICCIQKAKAKRIVASLLECGKLTKSDGKLSQDRAEFEVKRAGNRIERSSKAAQIRDKTRGKAEQKQRPSEIEIAGDDDATTNYQLPTTNYQPSTVGKKEAGVIEGDDAPSPPGPDDRPGQEVLPPDGKATEVDQVQAAFDRYNRMARASACPVANLLNAQRRSRLKARLKETGIDGWNDAVDRVARSEFCQGANDNGWVASLDFMLQATSFTRIIEGNFDNKQAAPRKGGGVLARVAMEEMEATRNGR